MKPKQQIILNEKQIESIADDLECGFRVFYNFRTKETESRIDRDSEFAFDLIEEEVEKWDEIDAHFEDYFEFEKMDSRKSFLIMEDFAAQVMDNGYKARLFDALNRRRPFANFKNEVESNSDYRESWFAYRRERETQWTKQEIENFNKA